MNYEKDLKLFHFGTYCVPSLDQGIQISYTQMSMFLKYKEQKDIFPEQEKMLWEWVRNPLIVLFNSVSFEDLKKLYDFFDTSQNEYPYCFFSGLPNGKKYDKRLTSVAIILPPKIYNAYSNLICGKRYKIKDNGEEYEKCFGDVKSIISMRDKDGYEEVKNALENYEEEYGKLNAYDIEIIEMIKKFRTLYQYS